MRKARPKGPAAKGPCGPLAECPSQSGSAVAEGIAVSQNMYQNKYIYFCRTSGTCPNQRLPCAKRCGRRDCSQYVQVRVEALWQKGLQSVKICIKPNIFVFPRLAAHAPIKVYHVQSAVAEGIAVSMSKSEWKRCGRRDCSHSKYASK